MQFVNYSDFRDAVLKLIDGDDTSTSFSLETVDLLIGLGENRAYRDLRVATMLADLSVVVVDNVAALPSDLIELKEAYFDARRPLQIVPLERLRELSYSSAGQTVYAAQDGDDLRFWPTASGTLSGKYYKRPTDMKSEATWANQTTLARYPEVFLFGALAESAPFIGEDQRIPIWEQKYAAAVEAAKNDDRWRTYGGSRLRMRTG